MVKILAITKTISLKINKKEMDSKRFLTLDNKMS
jgi:hypothetical protein